jgi:thiamine-phosphate pyrophosphorylase
LRKALPAVLAFTDPARTPDPVALAEALPRGTGLVYRHFGSADALPVARELSRVARRRGLILLIGLNYRLALAVGADGVHLPERLAGLACALRRAHSDWIVTSAAHSVRAMRAAEGDAVVISPAFPSRSTSAGAPLGPLKLAQLVRAGGMPAYALGGVTDRTAPRLLMTGIIGVAAVDGLRPR